jgi:hypothetical protein
MKLFQDFLKCTPIPHPDYPYLLNAQKELHNLAEKIDQVHKEVNEVYNGDNQSCLQIIQDLIDNLDDVCVLNLVKYFPSKFLSFL